MTTETPRTQLYDRSDPEVMRLIADRHRKSGLEALVSMSDSLKAGADSLEAARRALRECVELLESYNAIGDKDGTEHAWEQRKDALLARLKETL